MATNLVLNNGGKKNIFSKNKDWDCLTLSFKIEKQSIKKKINILEESLMFNIFKVLYLFNLQKQKGEQVNRMILMI